MVGLGLSAGILSGMFGIGGGIIIVPMLILILGYSQTEASGTSLIALLLPVGIFGALEYFREGRIGKEHLIFGFMIAVGMFMGAYFGARIATSIPETILRKSFAIGLVLVALKFWCK